MRSLAFVRSHSSHIILCTFGVQMLKSRLHLPKKTRREWDASTWKNNISAQSSGTWHNSHIQLGLKYFASGKWCLATKTFNTISHRCKPIPIHTLGDDTKPAHICKTNNNIFKSFIFPGDAPKVCAPAKIFYSVWCLNSAQSTMRAQTHTRTHSTSDAGSTHMHTSDRFAHTQTSYQSTFACVFVKIRAHITDRRMVYSNVAASVCAVSYAEFRTFGGYRINVDIRHRHIVPLQRKKTLRKMYLLKYIRAKSE